MSLMFLQADHIMAISMGIFILAIIGVGGTFGYKTIKKKTQGNKGPSINLVLMQEGQQKRVALKSMPSSGFIEYERGENDILPVYIDPLKVQIDRDTGDRYYYADEVTGYQFKYQSPHPKNDEEALDWLPLDQVKKILDGGLVQQFVKSWEPAWWEGLVKYLPWVIVIAALFALPQVIGAMRQAMSFVFFPGLYW